MRCKRSVDQDRRPGRFLLTGSADALTLPTVSESLAGRLETVILSPLSRAEIRGKRPAFLGKAFTGTLVKPAGALIGNALVEVVLTGGYPEMLRREDPDRRQAWAREYVRAIVQRDVRDIADVERLIKMARILRVLAHHSGQLTNFTQIGAQSNLDDNTTKNGRDDSRATVPRATGRTVVSQSAQTARQNAQAALPRFWPLSAIQGVTVERIARERTLLGPLLETFVFTEVPEQTTWPTSTTRSHTIETRTRTKSISWLKTKLESWSA